MEDNAQLWNILNEKLFNNYSMLQIKTGIVVQW